MKYRGMRVAVIGAAGFIGRWTARQLTAAGADLLLYVRHASAAEGVFQQYDVSGKVIAIDLRDFSAVRWEILAHQPEVIFNLAGYGINRSEQDEQLLTRINSELPSVLCEARAEYAGHGWDGLVVIQVGSALEYGQIAGDLDEASSPHPTSAYGKSKLAGTNAFSAACQNLGIRGATARLFTVYGPGEADERLLPSLRRLAKADDPLPLTDGLHRRDFTYVEDAAEGLLRLGVCRLESGAVVNVATGRLLPVREFVLAAAEIMNISNEQLLFGALPIRPEEMHHEAVSLKRLLAATGWTPPTSVPDGIRKTLDFENQRLNSRE